MEKALERQALGLLGERFCPYVKNRQRKYSSTLVWQYCLAYLRQARFPNTRYLDKALATAWEMLKSAPHTLFARVRKLLQQLPLLEAVKPGVGQGEGKVSIPIPIVHAGKRHEGHDAVPGV